MLTNEELEREGLKIAERLEKRIALLERQVSNCSTLTENDDGSEMSDDDDEVEKVEKFLWVYKDSDGVTRVTNDRFEDEDDFYNTYSSDDNEAIQPVDGSGEYMPSDEN